jgi:hypothetical protein
LPIKATQSQSYAPSLTLSLIFGEYLSLISNIGEMNNDQLELDRILSGEKAVRAQGDINPLQLDSGKEKDPDNKKNPDAEEV